MIDLSKANKHLWREITDESGDIRNCFNCGTCVSGCPAAEAEPPLLIRRLARMVLLGLEEELLEEGTPWICVTCAACEEMCPMGVHPFEVCLAIRRWQSKKDETYIPTAVTQLFQEGHTQPVGKAQGLRRSVGLEEVPPTIVKFPDLLDKFQTMLRETELVRENDYLFRV
ncbi:MAG: 4Fe-4S dicluster domain-containing protein [Dehalococcoidales bacterium]|nr:4Fe-4S dicluster domain-containing protein [Dehalococcoidales bacterium]